MLPKTKLGSAMYRKLKVYAGPDHPIPHKNQQSVRSSEVAVIEYYGTGRRKTSTARVYLRPGNGRSTSTIASSTSSSPPRRSATQIKQRWC